MIGPMLATAGHVTSLEEFILDDRWLMEQKVDGHRVMLLAVDGQQPAAVTRGGLPYTKRLPGSIVSARLPAGDWVLDGELVDTTYWVFDILAAGRHGLAHLPQTERRMWLVNTLASFEHPFKVVPQAGTVDDKISLAERSLSEHFEGLVLKRADAKYQYNQRSQLWLKVKYTHTADVVAMATRDDGRESVKLGAYANGDLVEVGRASLLGKETAQTVSAGDVLEIRYLYLGAQGHLVQPTVLRVRNDKAAQECTTDQFSVVNKSVLDRL